MLVHGNIPGTGYSKVRGADAAGFTSTVTAINAYAVS
jgi:hypothetical protein